MLEWKDLKNSDISFIEKFIRYMIDHGKSPNYISNQLKKYQIVNCTLSDAKTFIEKNFELNWNNSKKCWEQSCNTSLLTYTTVEYFNSYSSTKDLNNSASKEDKTGSSLIREHTITINSNIKISYVEELQLAYTVVDDGVEINVSPNDAATLLKNMAQIQSKLNEIARAINKISQAINSD